MNNFIEGDVLYENSLSQTSEIAEWVMEGDGG